MRELFSFHEKVELIVLNEGILIKTQKNVKMIVKNKSEGSALTFIHLI